MKPRLRTASLQKAPGLGRAGVRDAHGGQPQTPSPFTDCSKNSAICSVSLVSREVAKTNSPSVCTKFSRSSCRRRESGSRTRDWVGGGAGRERQRDITVDEKKPGPGRDRTPESHQPLRSSRRTGRTGRNHAGTRILRRERTNFKGRSRVVQGLEMGKDSCYWGYSSSFNTG